MQMSDEMRATNLNEGQTDTPLTESRYARVRAVRGKYAHVPTSSDAFARKKQEEIEQEARKSARLFPDVQWR